VSGEATSSPGRARRVSMKIKKGLKEVKEMLSHHHHHHPHQHGHGPRCHDREGRERKPGPNETRRGPLAPVLDRLEKDNSVPIHLHISHTGSFSITRKGLPPLPIPPLTLFPTTRAPWPTFINTSKPRKKNNKSKSSSRSNQSPSWRWRWRSQNLSSPLLVLLALSVPTAVKRPPIPSSSMIQTTRFLTQDRHPHRQRRSRLWIQYPCRHRSRLPSLSCSPQPRLSLRRRQCQSLRFSTSLFPRCQSSLTPSLSQKRRPFTSPNSCYRPCSFR